MVILQFAIAAFDFFKSAFIIDMLKVIIQVYFINIILITNLRAQGSGFFFCFTKTNISFYFKAQNIYYNIFLTEEEIQLVFET